jgi:hypothetical protein
MSLPVAFPRPRLSQLPSDLIVQAVQHFAKKLRSQVRQFVPSQFRTLGQRSAGNNQLRLVLDQCI